MAILYLWHIIEGASSQRAGSTLGCTAGMVGRIVCHSALLWEMLDSSMNMGNGTWPSGGSDRLVFARTE